MTFPTKVSLPELFHLCQFYPSFIVQFIFFLFHEAFGIVLAFPCFASLFYHLHYTLIHSVIITQPLLYAKQYFKDYEYSTKKTQFLLYEFIFKWMVQSNKQKLFVFKCNLMLRRKFKLGKEYDEYSDPGGGQERTLWVSDIWADTQMQWASNHGERRGRASQAEPTGAKILGARIKGLAYLRNSKNRPMLPRNLGGRVGGNGRKQNLERQRRASGALQGFGKKDCISNCTEHFIIPFFSELPRSPMWDCWTSIIMPAYSPAAKYMTQIMFSAVPSHPVHIE